MSGIDFDEVEFTTDDDLDEGQLEALLESGDEDAIEALLSGKPVSRQADDEETDLGGAKQEQATTTDDDELAAMLAAEAEEADPNKSKAPEQQDEKGPSSEAKEGAEGEPGQRKVVKSKDGAHEIPYAVLETTRQQLRDEQQKSARLEAEAAQLKALEEVNQQLRDQLERNNLKPGEMPQEIDMSPERIAQLKEDYGELGDVIEAMLNQNNQLRDQITAKGDRPATVEPVVTEEAKVDDAIGRNADLAAWSERDADGNVADPDRWAYAVDQDIQLRKDPAFKGKSYDERFAEVARRTRAAFGDADPAPTTQQQTVAEKAAARIREAEKSQHPQTLSDIGRPSVSEKSLAEQFEDMDEGEMLARMDSMTPEQIDRLFAG